MIKKIKGMYALVKRYYGLIKEIIIWSREISKVEKFLRQGVINKSKRDIK